MNLLLPRWETLGGVTYGFQHAGRVPSCGVLYLIIDQAGPVIRAGGAACDSKRCATHAGDTVSSSESLWPGRYYNVRWFEPGSCECGPYCA
jgi:hypothetical protein